MLLRKVATISDKLKTFIQSGNYEIYILRLMNQSKTVFPGEYDRHKVQSHSECDFYDVKTLEKYEAKLPFDKKEGELILSKINPQDYVITLEIKGQNITSEALAEKLENLKTYGTTNIVFVIGGSNGLSSEVIKRKNFGLSFSSFTFPHQLMRLILIEQIYRAYTIINHKEYHK